MNSNTNSVLLHRRRANPWVQLILGVVCMASVANMQYGWTLFVDPMDAKFHWGRSAIQIALPIFVAIETWLVPVEAIWLTGSVALGGAQRRRSGRRA